MLRYDCNDRPDQRRTAEATAGQQDEHRARAKNRQRGSTDAGGQVTEKELPGCDEACVALKIRLNRRLLPNRAEGEEQTKSRQEPNPLARHTCQVCPALLLLQLSTHTSPRGVGQILILTDAAAAVAAARLTDGLGEPC